MTLDDQLNSTLQFTYLILIDIRSISQQKNEFTLNITPKRKPTSMSVRKSALRCPGFLV